MAWDPNLTWIGYMGGGGSAALIVGGGVYQFELWNVGGRALPTRAYVTSKKVGLIAHAGVSHAMILVTGCKDAREMEGIKSSGLDWEFDAGASGKGIKASTKFKKYKQLFEMAKETAKQGARKTGNWAKNETSKRLVQYAMDDLGVAQSGKQFNLLPSPLSVGVGAGIAYDWQSLHVMGGKQAWSMISPQWYVENTPEGLRLQMYNIPEQDGAQLKIAIGVNEWGIDPYIRWKGTPGGPRVDARSHYQIIGHVEGGWLWTSPNVENPGIPLGKLIPSGRLETGMWSVSKTRTVQTGGSMKIYPVVINFGNYPYWTASDWVKAYIGKDGRLLSSSHAGKAKK